MNTLSVKDVKKKYRLGKNGSGEELVVLGGISLNIKKNDFIGIVGPNGCGKTTLFKLVLGAEAPDSGSISVFGKSPEESRVGYVPQHTSGALYPWFTVAENVAFASESSADESADNVMDKLEEFGIQRYANAYPYQLSGGIKQLVAMARATSNTDIFLFDEPLNGIDYQNRLLVEKMLLKLRDGPYTALIISHDIESAILLCDKIVILSEKPARIKGILPVQLPAERTLETRFSKEFNAILQEIYKMVRAG